MITTIIHSQNPCPSVPTVTYAGKTYNTVKISTQCWLKENLDVGTMIQGNQNPSNNGTIEKYCYNNDANNCNTYGGFYQWNEAMAYSTTPGTKGICPNGWHVPTDAELLTLFMAVDGNALKAIGQGTRDGTGTNISGFSALIAGHRNDGSNFYNLGTTTTFWSSTETSTYYAFNMELNGYNSYSLGNSFNKGSGFSVRCLKDESGTSVGGDNEKVFPTEYSLSQNYPNPFNPTTTINYSVPKESFVTIKIYDVVGKEVTTIVNGNKSVGNYSIEFDASKLVSEIYFYRIQAGNFTDTKKLILIK